MDELFLQASSSYKLVRSCAVSQCMYMYGMMSLCLMFYLVVRFLKSKLLCAKHGELCICEFV